MYVCYEYLSSVFFVTFIQYFVSSPSLSGETFVLNNISSLDDMFNKMDLAILNTDLVPPLFCGVTVQAMFNSNNLSMEFLSNSLCYLFDQSLKYLGSWILRNNLQKILN